MSVSTPTSEDDEVHDLVLMFANSRIPRGSDAFQTILEDLMPLKEQAEKAEQAKKDQGFDEVDSGNIEQSVMLNEVSRSKSNTPEEAHVRFNSSKHTTSSLSATGKLHDKRHVRTDSPKINSHVHWPNAERDIASSPTPEQLHHARLYMKTVPAKPCLKHEDINVQS